MLEFRLPAVAPRLKAELQLSHRSVRDYQRVVGAGTIIDARHSGHCACLPAAAAEIRSNFWHCGQRKSIMSAGGADGESDSVMTCPIS